MEKNNYPNMKSTVNTQGDVVTQIIHFVDFFFHVVSPACRVAAAVP
jgi:hypothetical protein